MDIGSDFLEMLTEIGEKITFPLIKQFYLPSDAACACRVANFGVLELEGGAGGIVYLNLSDKNPEEEFNQEITGIGGKSALEVAGWFNTCSDTSLKKAIGLGTINALSQFVFQKAGFQLETAVDSFGLLEIEDGDHCGMVGFFTPLVKKLENQNAKLTVIEKRADLVQSHPNWEVTLDPSKLRKCNKILITSTTILNDSIDEILSHCENAKFISMVGPSAGFLPDPLLKRGIHVIGGSSVVNTEILINRVQNGIRWGDSVQKYCIQREKYPGFRSLLSLLKEN